MYHSGILERLILLLALLVGPVCTWGCREAVLKPAAEALQAGTSACKRDADSVSATSPQPKQLWRGILPAGTSCAGPVLDVPWEGNAVGCFAFLYLSCGRANALQQVMPASSSSVQQCPSLPTVPVPAWLIRLQA